MNKKLYRLMNWPEIEGVVYAEETDPYRVLGFRTVGANTLFQTFIPDAEKVSLVTRKGKEEIVTPMEQADENGFFAVLYPGKPGEAGYEYEYTKNGETARTRDAYAYTGYEIKKTDLQKNLYEVLGAQVMTLKKTRGVRFAVWAPNALSVSVSGTFNGFDGRMHQMKKDPDLGLFELFVPDVKEGDRYCYEVKMRGGKVATRLDPFAKSTDLAENASVVTASGYRFEDDAWMKLRRSFKKEPAAISIYELSLNSFGSADYEALGESLSEYVKDMGYTHVSLMSLTEYLEDSSFGRNVLSYFAPTERLGSPDDLKKFVDTLHGNGIGVIMNIRLDAFDKEDLGLGNFDGTSLYENPDPRIAGHPEGDKLNFNFGSYEVREFLISSVLYWAGEFHIDGFLLDSLSSMLFYNFGKEGWEQIYNIYGGNENLEAVGFVKDLNTRMNKKFGDVLMIAEEVTGYPLVTGDISKDGLGFDLKLNNGFISDYLSFICDHPERRYGSFNRLSESMAYQYTENFISALSKSEFLNGYPSMIGRLPGNEEEKFANLRLSLTFLYTRPGRKLIFTGQDIGVPDPYDPMGPVDLAVMKKAMNKGVRSLVRTLNKLYRGNTAFYELDDKPGGFEWINAIPNEQCILSFLRKGSGGEDAYLVVCNFSGEERTIRVGTPLPGKYREVINTDAKEFGGSGSVNARSKAVSETEADGRPFSVELRLAPYAASVLKYIPFTEEEKESIRKRKEAAVAKTRAEAFRQEAEEELKTAEEERIRMEEASARMKEALRKAKEAQKHEKEELDRAKRLLEEA